MKKLSVILEQLDPKRVFRNITPRTLMGLAKQHGTTRFVVDAQNRIHAGDAHHLIHDNLYIDRKHAEGSKDEGIITHWPISGITAYQSSAWEPQPHTKALEKLGAVYGSRNGDFDDIQCIPFAKDVEAAEKKYNKSEIDQLAKDLEEAFHA